MKESIFCDFTAGIYQLHIKCNTHSHYFILIFTHELTCCWQSSFRNSLIKWCTLINSSSSTLWYFKCTLDKQSSGIRNDLQDLTWISEKKTMSVANRNMKAVSDQANSPFCLWQHSTGCAKERASTLGYFPGTTSRTLMAFGASWAFKQHLHVY